MLMTAKARRADGHWNMRQDQTHHISACYNLRTALLQPPVKNLFRQCHKQEVCYEHFLLICGNDVAARHLH